MNKIILASKSPRRRQLLEMAEIDFDIISLDTDESYPPDLPIAQIPAFIAQHKALPIAAQYPDRLVLSADTIVVLENKIIGKPKDRQDAIDILKQLSGRTHEVITGVWMQHNGISRSFSDRTQVEFHSISTEQIEFYVDKYQPFDKAGAYAIQEWIGAIAIKRIEGCFYNVMGLPISKVVNELLLF